MGQATLQPESAYLWEILCSPAVRRTGFSREGGISNETGAVFVATSSRPVPRVSAKSVGDRDCLLERGLRAKNDNAACLIHRSG